MNNKILNITNGDAFNEYFVSKHGGLAVPFREAMMDGETVLDIYSEEFISVRSTVLCVSVEEYKSKMLTSGGLDILEYSKLCLWFGKDTFCQMNLLTLLAYLEQIEYRGEISLNFIDDETFEVIEENIDVELGIYKRVYEDILVSKCMPNDIGALNLSAVELYFDYHSNDGTLAKIVGENSNLSEIDLICLLLDSSKEYGLSDIQAKKLIERNRK